MKIGTTGLPCWPQGFSQGTECKRVIAQHANEGCSWKVSRTNLLSEQSRSRPEARSGVADEHWPVNRAVVAGVGTDHHTKGTRTPARLPVSVQRYLLEEEGLDYSEPQPCVHAKQKGEEGTCKFQYDS
ncbi:hypothetical protein L6452_27121 [Arctium lappa]|uniref:Uncharacterized protein n=1 Tax=Arctium lappa TaxID=4217 RepID=A0ACB8ZW62_ARCLA|nr:hypothetical protein L6452_27121 [Arctium lappa]